MSSLFAQTAAQRLKGGAAGSALRDSEAHYTRTRSAVPQEYNAIGFATNSEERTAAGHTALPIDWYGMSDICIPLSCCNTKYGGSRPLEHPRKASRADHPLMWLSELLTAAHCTPFGVAPLACVGLPEATQSPLSIFLVR